MEEIKILETDSIELEELGKNEVKEIEFDKVSLALESEEEDGEIQTSDVVLRQKNEEGKEIKYLVLYLKVILYTPVLILTQAGEGPGRGRGGQGG